jgi:superfamily II DNA or RNA helicase
MPDLFTQLEVPSRLRITPRAYQAEDLANTLKLYSEGERGVLTRIFTGGGKCLGYDTPVLLHSGQVIAVQDVEPGDLLMGPDSCARRVLATSTGRGKLFRIVPTRGTPFVVNEDHILTLKATNFSATTICGLHPGEVVDISLRDYLAQAPSYRHIAKGFRVGVEFTSCPVPLDPYVMGIWLGDGTWGKPHVTTADDEVVDALRYVATELKLVLRKGAQTGKAFTYRLSKTSGNTNPLLDILREVIEEDHKHIPFIYKVNSRDVRLQVLAGLMDSDGHLHNGGFDYISKQRQLSEDVAFVARSLGLRALVSECIKTCSNNGVSGTYWRVSISGDCSIIPTKLPHKQAAVRKQKKDPLMFGFTVEDVGQGDYYGFVLDGDGRFLLGDYTVTHNTICACMAIDEWLARGPNYHAMVISYEMHLVWQFAQEIEDVLGVTPGIEMGKEKIDRRRIPRVVVASRQSLMKHKLATDEQKAELSEHGLNDVGLLTASLAKRMLKELPEHLDLARDTIQEHNAHWRCNHDVGEVSRLFKFPHNYNWLLVWDEAHKHAHHLKTVGHIHDWFHQNEASWNKGLTATPKRSDSVSIGDKMFPGISIDFALTKAVAEGYAVPYVQKYICCDNVDFKQVKQVAGDFDEGDLERVLFAEGELAKLCEPMLDMVGDRRTLIFSPTVQTAKDVCNYVNARRELTCPKCQGVRWIAHMLIGDGAACKCGHIFSESDITKHGHQAGVVYGEMPPNSRKEIYRQHQSGAIQFLSVCSLCKEGYNDPDIGAVAVFRPVTKKASSLAEQMKGRGSRPARGLIEGMDSAEERLQAIADSEFPNCLVIDLVGITGLADCASTASIYADGREDEVVERAEELQVDGVEDVQEALETAEQQIADERAEAARIRQEEEERQREEAEKRAKAEAEVSYTTHEIGHGSDPNMMTEAQYKGLRWRGIELQGVPPSKRQASRMISQLEDGMPAEEVVYHNGIKEGQWEPSRPSVKQQRLMMRYNLNAQAMTPKQASLTIDAIKAGEGADTYATGVYDKIKAADSMEKLNGAGRAVKAGRSRGLIDDLDYQALVNLGKETRERLQPKEF